MKENGGVWGVARQVLKSPLDLALKLIKRLNENRYADLADQLDAIKQFVAGVERAKSLGDYGLARFYPTMFAFHQFFNTSFRARQGKVLESILKGALKSACPDAQVPQKLAEMRRELKESLGVETRLDVDLLAKREGEIPKLLIAQIRSRDDTGGTTAKGSLVDLLRLLLGESKSAEHEVMYLVAVWDERRSLQKEATISKMFASLKQYLALSEEEFSAQIKKSGVRAADGISLRLAYGVSEIATAFAEFCGEEVSGETYKAIEQAVQASTDWDDLWVAYAVATLELENYLLHGVSNLEILKNRLAEKGIALGDGFDEKEIDCLAVNLAFEWNDAVLPLQSVSDQVHYIRDLLYLRLIYSRQFA